ncbi:MAG: pilus assembly protein PilM [Candidatus Neomarinimicrobiota bacterium]
MFLNNRIAIIDIGSNVFKVMVLRQKTHLQIEFWEALDIYKTGKIARPEDLNSTVVVQILREMLKSIRPAVRHVRSVLSSPGCMIRIIELPLLPEAELKAAIRLNLAGLIPYETDRIEFNFSVLSEDREQKTQTLLVALVPTEEIELHIEILRRAGLEAENVIPDQLAIYNCFHQLYSSSESDTVAIVNVGANRSTICFHCPGQRPSFSSLALGGNFITNAIAQHFHTSFLNAEEMKIGVDSLAPDPASEAPPAPARETALQHTVGQIADTIRTMDLDRQIRNCESHLSKIILTGGGARLKQFDYLLADSLKKPVYLWNPFCEPAMRGLVAPEVAETWGTMSVPALGLALGGIV